MTLTTSKYTEELKKEHIPYTFKDRGRLTLQKKKTAELDIFFLIVTQEIKDQEELETLNY